MEKPDPRIHRFLISTTSRFTGEYDSEEIRLDHAWPTGDPHRLRVGLKPNPHSRNYFVLSVVIEPPEKKSIVIPNYTPLGEQVCAASSVFYGKRFDCHGLLVSRQAFYLPNFGPNEPTTYYTAAPYSHQPRKDLEIPLKLDKFGAVAPLFTDESLNEKFRRIFFAAGRFYVRALQIFDREPEFAYLDLITCGEILANFFDNAPVELYDEATKTTFERISAEMVSGNEVVRQLQGRMLQIKRRYILTIGRLLTDAFFCVSECTESYGQLRRGDTDKRLKAAYDLRSQYVHTGINFGQWTHPQGGILNEVPLGEPVVDSKEFRKAISCAPTFFGLERIMRYCLLRFLHLNGVPIHPALDDSREAPAGKTESETLEGTQDVSSDRSAETSSPPPPAAAE